jgi:hypothetical protein
MRSSRETKQVATNSNSSRRRREQRRASQGEGRQDKRKPLGGQMGGAIYFCTHLSPISSSTARGARRELYRIYNHGEAKRERRQGMPGTNKTEGRKRSPVVRLLLQNLAARPPSFRSVADIKRAGRGGRRRQQVAVNGKRTTTKKARGGVLSPSRLSSPTCLHPDGRLRVDSSSPRNF